uniref:Uncharacterized protein n=1 Tax=Tanacetum cinerariifolium TaxID=118510 RepID=A0A6L2N8D7_TANCI|nr:hypothetical protein [Tanacetum cinerariifolium]
MGFGAEAMRICLMVMVSVVGYWETGQVYNHVGCINVPLDLCGSLAGQYHKSGVCSYGGLDTLCDEETIAFGVDGSWWVKSDRIVVVLAAMADRIPFSPFPHS